MTWRNRPSTGVCKTSEDLQEMFDLLPNRVTLQSIGANFSYCPNTSFLNRHSNQFLLLDFLSLRTFLWHNQQSAFELMQTWHQFCNEENSESVGKAQKVSA